MSVRIAFNGEGWNGPGVYGDFEACGRVADVDGMPLANTDYDGHIHELPLVPAVDPLMELFGFEPEEKPSEEKLLADTIDLLTDYGWDRDEITVVASLATV